MQEATVKALANRQRFTPGTHVNAWLFTILRNLFYDGIRKAKREVEGADGVHAATLTALPEQGGVVEQERLRDYLTRIPEAQCTALLMAGAEGYTYEKAAELLQCKFGTVESQVCRARPRLSDVFGLSGAEAPDAFAEHCPVQPEAQLVPTVRQSCG